MLTENGWCNYVSLPFNAPRGTSLLCYVILIFKQHIQANCKGTCYDKLFYSHTLSSHE